MDRSSEIESSDRMMGGKRRAPARSLSWPGVSPAATSIFHVIRWLS